MKNKNIRQIKGIQKEAESLVVELKKTTDPQVRAEKIVSAWRWIAGQVPILQARSAAVVREFARMEAIYHGPPTEPVVVHARREDVAEGEHQDAGFWLVTIIEMIAASKLASMYWRLSAWLSILIAALFAWITSKALTPVAVGFIRQGADRQGEVMKGRARRMLIIIGIPWFLSLVGAIWTLRSGAGMVGDVLFEVCTALVTFLSPAFAAACRASATHFTWSAPLEEEDAAIRLAMASIEMLRIALERAEGPAPVLGQTPPRVNGPAATAVVPGELPAHAEFHAGVPSSLIATALAIVAAVFITEPARAQESHFSQSTIAKSSTVNTEILRLKGKLDKSSSPNKSRMIARFNSFLNAVADDPREIVIELVAFGSDAWDETLIGSAHLAPLSGGRCSRELSERNAKLSNPALPNITSNSVHRRPPKAVSRLQQTGFGSYKSFGRRLLDCNPSQWHHVRLFLMRFRPPNMPGADRRSLFSAISLRLAGGQCPGSHRSRRVTRCLRYQSCPIPARRLGDERKLRANPNSLKASVPNWKRIFLGWW